ncbi:MAG: hypothetical protein ABIV47_04040 [Roseiflexaceae bacterium]
MQFSAGGGPANLHLTVNRSNVPRVDELLADLGASIATVKANSRIGDVAALQVQVELLMQGRLRPDRRAGRPDARPPADWLRADQHCAGCAARPAARCAADRVLEWAIGMIQTVAE